MHTHLSRNQWLYLLIFVVSVAYLPFLNTRVLRMAGDEKVYISQSIEMARDARWFVQTIADQPDYYKGPVHYIATRVGLFIFGTTLLAGTWMNWFFALVGAIGFFTLGLKRFSEEKAFLLGLSAALTVGAYSHAFASQMEVELIGLYTLATAFLGLEHYAKKSKNTLKNSYLKDLPFWITAAVAGCVKSPLHAALIGMGGILFWILNGSALKRLANPGSWLAALTGIILCLAGYAPAYFLDQKNFVEAFLARENVNKVNNGRHIDYVLRSLPHFMLPWSGAALGGLGLVILSIFKPKKYKLAEPALVKLGVAMATPTIIFFCLFPYKGQNYNIPTISALILTGFAAFGEFPRWSHRIASALGAVLFFTFAAVIGHFFGFFNMPEWWPVFYVIATFSFMAIFIICFWMAHNAKVIAVGTLMLFAAFALAITPVGTRELRGLTSFIKANPNTALHYYNLEPTIWSEWGLMELATGKEVRGVHKEEQLHLALAPGHALLVPGNEALENLQAHAKRAGVSLAGITTHSWVRWLTKGTNKHGEKLWSVAWQTRDLRFLEREFYILTPTATP